MSDILPEEILGPIIVIGLIGGIAVILMIGIATGWGLRAWLVQ